jgi:hypothetical protein
MDEKTAALTIRASLYRRIFYSSGAISRTKPFSSDVMDIWQLKRDRPLSK